MADRKQSASNLDVLAYEPSPIGMICLRRRELLSEPGTVVTEITLDHEFLMSSYNTASERGLARCALEMHNGKNLDVLVGGLGLGYTAHEALASDRVSRVEVVELLPQVIDWLSRGLIPLADELNGEPRLEIREGDVFALLSERPRQTYDLILIDVDHSPDAHLGDANAWFYSEAGLRTASHHLTEGGVLGVWSYEESAAFTAAHRSVFGEVRVEPVTFWNPIVDEEETNWLFFVRK